jgi:hypothetical protein
MRLRVSVPVTSLLPGLHLDPLKALTGRSLAEVLQPVLEADPWTKSGQTVYPLALPEGVGVAIPLGGFGELGFQNTNSQLQLTAPAAVALFLHQLPHQVGGVELLATEQGRLSRFTLAPPRGAIWRIPITGTLALTLTRL